MFNLRCWVLWCCVVLGPYAALEGLCLDCCQSAQGPSWFDMGAFKWDLRPRGLRCFPVCNNSYRDLTTMSPSMSSECLKHWLLKIMYCQRGEVKCFVCLILVVFLTCFLIFRCIVICETIVGDIVVKLPRKQYSTGSCPSWSTTSRTTRVAQLMCYMMMVPKVSSSIMFVTYHHHYCYMFTIVYRVCYCAVCT